VYLTGTGPMHQAGGVFDATSYGQPLEPLSDSPAQDAIDDDAVLADCASTATLRTLPPASGTFSALSAALAGARTAPTPNSAARLFAASGTASPRPVSPATLMMRRSSAPNAAMLPAVCTPIDAQLREDGGAGAELCSTSQMNADVSTLKVSQELSAASTEPTHGASPPPNMTVMNPAYMQDAAAALTTEASAVNPAYQPKSAQSPTPRSAQSSPPPKSHASAQSTSPRSHTSSSSEHLGAVSSASLSPEESLPTLLHMDSLPDNLAQTLRRSLVPHSRSQLAARSKANMAAALHRRSSLDTAAAAPRRAALHARKRSAPEAARTSELPYAAARPPRPPQARKLRGGAKRELPRTSGEAARMRLSCKVSALSARISRDSIPTFESGDSSPTPRAAIGSRTKQERRARPVAEGSWQRSDSAAAPLWTLASEGTPPSRSEPYSTCGEASEYESSSSPPPPASSPQRAPRKLPAPNFEGDHGTDASRFEEPSAFDLARVAEQQHAWRVRSRAYRKAKRAAASDGPSAGTAAAEGEGTSASGSASLVGQFMTMFAPPRTLWKPVSTLPSMRLGGRMPAAQRGAAPAEGQSALAPGDTPSSLPVRRGVWQPPREATVAPPDSLMASDLLPEESERIHSAGPDSKQTQLTAALESDIESEDRIVDRTRALMRLQHEHGPDDGGFDAVQFHLGRPHFGNVFARAALEAKRLGERRVAVLVCGNAAVTQQCLSQCASKIDGVQFDCHVESFGF
jgi:hypothetical protein